MPQTQGKQRQMDYSLSLAEDMYRYLQAVAQRHHVSMAHVVRQLIRNAIERKGEYDRPKTAPKPHFHIGDKIQVKEAVMDQDVPSVCMAGWKGVISNARHDLELGFVYEIQWDTDTLAAMPTEYIQFCASNRYKIKQTEMIEEEIESVPFMSEVHVG
jgi:hypothetical protein